MIINVTKIDGRKEPLNIEKIRKYTKGYVPGNDENMVAELESDVQLHFKDGMSTADIHDALIRECTLKTDVGKLEWDKFAKNLFVSNFKYRLKKDKNIFDLKSYIRENKDRLNDRILSYTEDELNLLKEEINEDNDFKEFTYNGIVTLLNSWANKKGDSIIETPQYLYMGLAMFLASNEERDSWVYWSKKFYYVLTNHYALMGTPTMSKSRSKRPQLSSCYVGATPDSIEGIMDANKTISILSKFGGGIGWDFSPIRSVASEIDGYKGVAGGSIPFLKITNDVTLAVDQLGCVVKDSYVKVIDDINEINERIIPIYKLKKGDLIKSYNHTLNKVEYQTVLETYDLTVEIKDQVLIVFENGVKYLTSAWHPVPKLIDGEYKYVRADSIKENDITVGDNGEELKIVSVKHGEETGSKTNVFFDITVKDNNNYFCASFNSDNNIFGLIHNTRPGALAPYQNTCSLEIIDFLDLRKNSGEERRRAHDLFLAVILEDRFMEAVENDEEWLLVDQYEVPELIHAQSGEVFKSKYEETLQRFRNNELKLGKLVSAKDLWKKIIRSYYETGYPFLFFKTTANEKHMGTGTIRSSNLCTEIFQATAPAEYDMVVYMETGNKIESIYIPRTSLIKIGVRNKDGKIKYRSGTIKEITAATDSVYVTLKNPNDKEDEWTGQEFILENILNAELVKDKVSEELAVCNLSSINLAKINTKEAFEEIIPIVVRMLDNVIDLNFYPVLAAALTNKRTRAIGLGVAGENELIAGKGIHYGSEEHKEFANELYEMFAYYTIKASVDLAKEKGKAPAFDDSKWANFDHKEYSTLASKIPEDELDIPKPKYFMDWVGLEKDIRENGMRNIYLMAIAPTSTIASVLGTTSSISPIINKLTFESNSKDHLLAKYPSNLSAETWNFYTNGFKIDQIEAIKVNAIRQRWIDQGISYNVRVLQGDVTGTDLHNIYMTAWKYGMKSTYYLNSIPKEKEEEKQKYKEDQITCVNCE